MARPYFPRPRSEYLHVKKERVQGRTCPKCGGKNISRYSVLKSVGWVITTKCQDCLYELEREPTSSMFGAFKPMEL